MNEPNEVFPPLIQATDHYTACCCCDTVIHLRTTQSVTAWISFRKNNKLKRFIYYYIVTSIRAVHCFDLKGINQGGGDGIQHVL